MCHLPIQKQGLCQFEKCCFISVMALLASVVVIFLPCLIKRVVLRFHLNSDIPPNQIMVNFIISILK